MFGFNFFKIDIYSSYMNGLVVHRDNVDTVNVMVYLCASLILLHS